MILKPISVFGYEKVLFVSDPSTQLRAIISIHSTRLGPAIGGCHFAPYLSFDGALADALRLSVGLTRKSAVSGLNWGGGAAIILGDPQKDPKSQKTPELLRTFAETIATLNGSYRVAQDLGIDADDLQAIRTVTRHALGTEATGSESDPSPATARGAFHGIQVALRHHFGSPSLKGRKVAVQGLGSVACLLIEHLLASGAEVMASDADPRISEQTTRRFGIKRLHPESIYDTSCDVFAPCAFGPVLNARTISVLRAKVVAGSADSPLASEQDAQELHRRGILYAPDFVISAGGWINRHHINSRLERYSRTRAFEHVTEIGHLLHEIFARAEIESRSPHAIAVELANTRLELTQTPASDTCPTKGSRREHRHQDRRV